MNIKNCRHLFGVRLLVLILSFSLMTSLALVGTPGFLPRQAMAVTSAEKQAEADEALERLEALQAELEQIVVDYNAAEVAHAEAEERKIEARIRVEAAEERIGVLQAQLGERAQSMYRNGQISVLDFLFGAESFTQLITALDLINRVNEQDAKLVADTKIVHTQAEEARVEFTKQEVIAKQKQDELATLMAEMEQAATDLAAEVDALKEEAQVLLVQEQLYAEQARKAAAAGGTTSVGPVSDEQLSRIRGLALSYPLPYKVTPSSGFGWRSYAGGSYHLGLDLPAPGGTNILASADGMVVAAQFNYSMGNYVIVDHGNGVTTTYMHASKLIVRAGTQVSRGETLSLVGTTGDSTGNHLHFQVEVDRIAVNPALFLEL